MTLRNLGLSAAILLISAWVALPLMLIALAAFTPRDLLYQWPRSFWPESFTLETMRFFLRSTGVEVDKDADWLAWALVPAGPERPQEFFLGFAQGQFKPEKVEEYYQKQKLPVVDYRGMTLYPFGSGVSEEDLLFIFLDSSTAASNR